MSSFIARTPKLDIDPLTEHLANLDPSQVDALEMMRGVYSNQLALSAAVVSLVGGQYVNSENVTGLATSVAVNALPEIKELKEQIINEL